MNNVNHFRLRKMGARAICLSLGFSVSFSGFSGQAISANSTEQDVVDSILGRTPYSTPLDLNSDGQVTVQDLVLHIQARLDGEPVEVFFASPSSVAKSWEGTHEVTIRFSRAVSGHIRLALSGGGIDRTNPAAIGTAVPGEKDIQEFPINNVDHIKVPIPIAPSAKLGLAKSLILTLGKRSAEDRIALPSDDSEQTNRFSAHEIRIVDHDSGLYSGVIDFPPAVTEVPNGNETEVIFAPNAPIGPIKVMFANQNGEAVLEIRDHPFLPKRLVIPGAAGLPASKQASGAITLRGQDVPGFGDRSVSWEIGLGAFELFEGSDQVATAPVVVRVFNLTASGSRPLEATGKIRLTLAEPSQNPET